MKYYLYTSLICTCLIVSCSKDPNYLFEVENVEINQASADKNRLKTDIEFVSIAYNDLYGQNISQGELDDIITVYKSFGDKSLVIEMIIRKFISNEDVKNKFGVDPSKVIDVQALAGDSSDNVPGVPGIGVKTAAELINKYGSLEKLLSSTREIK